MITYNPLTAEQITSSYEQRQNLYTMWSTGVYNKTSKGSEVTSSGSFLGFFFLLLVTFATGVLMGWFAREEKYNTEDGIENNEIDRTITGVE